jgi:hypothetical protein
MQDVAGPAHPTQRSGLNRTDHTREVESYEAGPIREQPTTTRLIRGTTDQQIADEQSNGQFADTTALPFAPAIHRVGAQQRSRLGQGLRTPMAGRLLSFAFATYPEVIHRPRRVSNSIQTPVRDRLSLTNAGRPISPPFHPNASGRGPQPIPFELRSIL